MQNADEYSHDGAHVSALTVVVETLLAHVIALQATPEAAASLIAHLRRASRHPLRFVADDDQHETPVSPYEAEVEACIGRIVDQALLRHLPPNLPAT